MALDDSNLPRRPIPQYAVRSHRLGTPADTAIALSGARFAFKRMTALETDPDHDADAA